MEKRRITLVANTSWNIYNFRLPLVKALQEKGIEVHAIAPKDEYSDLIQKHGIIFHPIPLSQKRSNLISDSISLWRLFRCFQVIKPSHSLNFTIKPNLYVTLLSKLLGFKSINNVSGLGTVFLHDTLSSKIAHQLYKIIFPSSFHVFFQNEADAQFFIQKRWVKKNQSTVIPGSGVDTERIQPSNKINGETIHFVMVARLLFDKGILEFLNAASMIKQEYNNVQFHLIGKLEDELNLGLTDQELNKWVQQSIVTYHGFSDAVLDIVAKMDVMVLPSYREGMSKVLLEALALGLPLVTTNVPGCKEAVIEGWNGYLCEAKSTDSLYLAIKKMIELSSEERSEMGKHSRQHAVQYFSQENVVKAYLKVIE